MTAVAVPSVVARPRRSRLPAVAAVAAPLLLVLGFLATNVSASLAQRSLAGEWDAAVAAARAMTPAQIADREYAPGDPVARISIPAIRLDAVVVEGATPALMRRAPAHVTGTPIPGDEGTAVVSGNRLGFGGFFADLDRLATGDLILVETLAGPRTFRVESTQVTSRVPPFTTSGTPRLALIAGARRWGGEARLVVVASEVTRS